MSKNVDRPGDVGQDRIASRPDLASGPASAPEAREAPEAPDVAVPPDVAIPAPARTGPAVCGIARTTVPIWLTCNDGSSGIGIRSRSDFSRHVTVLFNVHPDGEMSGLRVKESSGVDTADAAALKAVENSAPFEHLPPGAKEAVDIQFTFDYNVFQKKSLTLSDSLTPCWD